MIRIPAFLGIILILLVGLTAGGSQPPDERIAEMAKQSRETQAWQHDRLAEPHR